MSNNASTIKRYYQQSVTTAISWLRGNSYTCYPIAPVITTSFDGNHIILKPKQCFFFKSWPMRDRSQKTISILASFIETIDLANMKCVKSTSRVSYYKIDGDIAYTLESIHFDADIQVQPAHPICHTQFSNRSIITQNEAFQYNVNDDFVKNRIPNIRLPSSHMNMPGLFQSLTANHLKKSEWKDFIMHCSSHFSDIPKLPGDGIVSRFSEAGLSTLNWFDY
ncbi:MAG: hypothetical protein K9N35_02625 [Candidatus Marinimicrobia bacterium]|nr:hypothetical protein [Candidatus Neomarinimicrobiota bacterium]